MLNTLKIYADEKAENREHMNTRVTWFNLNLNTYVRKVNLRATFLLYENVV